jgi:hypothetical protein
MSVLKSVVMSGHSKTFLAAVSVLVVVAGTLFGANVASADSIQVQGYQRASQTEACVAQVGETAWQASWGPDATWKPSWEQWANKGAGGWVCTRSITWAKTPVLASSSSGGGGAVTYRVGDVGPGGGTVFYVDMNRAAGSQFWEVGSALGLKDWGCIGTDIAGTGTAIGTGEANTAAIMVNCLTLDIAARVASAPAGGYSDWFLPSKDELNQLCKYARAQSSAVVDQTVRCDWEDGTFRSGFVGGNYWSSSQFDMLPPSLPYTHAWYQYFNGGVQREAPKFNDPLNVLPIRAF